MKLNTSIAIPEDLKRDLKAIAAQRGDTMNEAIIAGIRLYLLTVKTEP